MGEMAIRNDIQNVEEAMLEHPDVHIGDTEACPLTHEFVNGIYVRTIQIPANSLVVGKIHRHAHPNFLMKGVVTVLTEDGGTEILKAPCSMISPAGTKRVVFTHMDCEWTTVHATDATTPEEAVLEIVAPSYEDEELNSNQVKALETLCH
jgi:hypothetical protein